MASIDQMLAATPFDGEQTKNAQIILAQFSAAGLAPGIGWAAVVNAWSESMLDPLVCFGRTPWGADRGFGPIPGMEDSCGLFQLNASSNAAGAGMSAESRMDPVQNTRRIIEIVNSDDGLPLRQAAAGGAALSSLVALFTEDIERPANAYEEGQDRAALALSWWPAEASQSASLLPFAAAGASLLSILAVLAGAGLVFFLYMKK